MFTDALEKFLIQSVFSPMVKFFVADIAIPLMIMLALMIYMLIRRKLTGKKVTLRSLNQVSDEELARQAAQVNVPYSTIFQTPASSTVTFNFLPNQTTSEFSKIYFSFFCQDALFGNSYSTNRRCKRAFQNIITNFMFDFYNYLLFIYRLAKKKP